MKKILLFFVSFFLLLAVSNAQDVIYLNNGNVVKGKVVKNTDEVSVLLGSGETITYRKAEVREVQIGNTEVTKPQEPKGKGYVDYSDLDKGWWCAVEVHAGAFWYWDKPDAAGVFALTFTNGYRFSEYFKLGVGFGVRYNLNDNDTYKRYQELKGLKAPLSIPIFLNLRGNIISQKSRICVPFWNADIGYAVFDSFFFDAGLGMRVGGKRNNFVLSFNYMGQLIQYNPDKTRFGNGFLFKIGYEF